MSISWENAFVNGKEKNETLEFTADPTINSKIKAVVTGLPKSISNLFLEFMGDHDKKLVADFLDSSLKQENVSLNTKRIYLIALAYLARWAKKPLDTIIANELYDYVNSFQQKKKDPTTNNNEDPDQSWISTQRTLCLPLLKFFKWLSYPELTTQQRKRLPREKWPDVLRRFELATKQTGSPKTPVKDNDIWKEKDTAIFLKYCADNPRLRLYHSLAWETSARPSELLHLKIGDIEDNIQLDEEGAPCAVFKVGRYGKTKYSFRDVGITKLSLQYYNRYLPSHPDSTNRKAYLFASLEYSALGRNLPISEGALLKEYTAFRDKLIPKLLKRPDMPEEDKKHLQFLRDVRKWYPYIIRHSSIDKLANAPTVNEHKLRRHAGWSKRSNMVEIYTHGGDSVEDVMLAYGVKLKNSKKKLSEELKQEMIGPLCPFCLTSNVPGTQLCIKCGKPIASNSLDSMMKEAEQRTKELETKIEEMQRTEAAREEKIRRDLEEEIERKIERNNERLAKSTENMTEEMRKVYTLLHKLKVFE